MTTESKQGRGRRLRRIALWGSVSLLTLVLLAASFIWMADLGFIRPKVEQILTDLTGRQFEIRGGLEVDAGNRVIAVARDVRWENADWDGPDQMLTVGYAEVHLDLWALLGRRVEIEYVEVSNADVVLSRQKDGPFNWDVFGSDAEAKADSDGPGWSFLLRQVDIDDVRVVLTSPRRDRPIRLNVARLDQRHRDDDILELDFTGTLGDRDASFRGETGPWSAIQ